LFDVQIAEKSTEGRAIYQVKIGNGYNQSTFMVADAWQ
jgi:hypothetical protein